MFDQGLLGHENNIIQKCRLSSDPRHQALCDEILRQYRLYASLLQVDRIASGDLEHAILAVESYFNFAKIVESKEKMFNWRSDFAGSILPEFIYRIMAITTQVAGIPALFSTRDSIVEVTLSGSVGGGWDVRRKNQDLCIGLRYERVVRAGVEEVFLVPLVALEVKTNIDINKLNGLDFSAERLKKTFPATKYFLATETIDFSLQQNYASGSIDEIYTLRKQIRSDARRVKDTLKADVFVQLQADVMDFLRKSSSTMGHVYDRLPSGRLINGTY